MDDSTPGPSDSEAAWQGVSAAFAALGRAFLCLDDHLTVLHASAALDRILGTGAAAAVEGRRMEALLGHELFGPGGQLRVALAAGERREGWRGFLSLGNGERRLVSITVAPFPRELYASCDPRVAHVAVLRPAETETEAAGPTLLGGIVARSRAMQRIVALVENLRDSDATVLITGESGTGKEVIARALHERSQRRTAALVAVNCAALPAELLESEMFGHARGAFTGAIRDRVGRFELASDATLFLDEIGDLPLPLQVKLLRALQDGSFQRVGESTSRVSRARIIAATNVDLALAVHEGRFRSDLYYRLRVVPIDVPPLRERREDIEPLARVLLARVSASRGRALQLSPDALRVFLNYPWPGNARELENALEYAVAVTRGQTILPEDLPPLGGTTAPGLAPPSPVLLPPAATPPSEPSDQALREALIAHRWRRADAARALGVSRTTLWRRMREAGLV
jgi:transcriptional regulator with GAF, ATPase, and Fis domain